MAAPHRVHPPSSRPTSVSRLRGRVNTQINHASDYLNKKSSSLGQRKLRHLLLLVVACWGTACVVIILDSLLSHKTVYPREKLSYPEPFRDEPSGDSNLFGDRRQIAQFQWYLDSLREHDPDRYLRMVTTRPWKVDSVHRAEGNLSLFNDRPHDTHDTP